MGVLYEEENHQKFYSASIMIIYIGLLIHRKSSTHQDTYHGKPWNYILWKRLYNLLKWDAEKGDERISWYNIMSTDLKERIDCVEEIIKEEKPRLVVIDQIEDIVTDPYSQADASKSVWRLNNLAENYRCNILGIIYKYADEEEYDYPFRAEWEYKSRDVFTVEKKKSQDFETFILTHKESNGPVMERPMKWRLESFRDLITPV